MISGVQNVVH